MDYAQQRMNRQEVGINKLATISRFVCTMYTWVYLPEYNQCGTKSRSIYKSFFLSFFSFARIWNLSILSLLAWPDVHMYTLFFLFDNWTMDVPFVSRSNICRLCQTTPLSFLSLTLLNISASKRLFHTVFFFFSFARIFPIFIYCLVQWLDS